MNTPPLASTAGLRCFQMLASCLNVIHYSVMLHIHAYMEVIKWLEGFATIECYVYDTSNWLAVCVYVRASKPANKHIPRTGRKWNSCPQIAAGANAQIRSFNLRNVFFFSNGIPLSTKASVWLRWNIFVLQSKMDSNSLVCLVRP